jgi:hypothetical protein
MNTDVKADGTIGLIHLDIEQEYGLDCGDP